MPLAMQTNVCYHISKCAEGDLNMVDTSLLEKDGAISMEDLIKLFQTNDFSAMVSLYDSDKATGERNQLYHRAKKHFRIAWDTQMKMLTGKGSLANFSKFSPVRVNFGSRATLARTFSHTLSGK
jgi:hypothetical protein